jgi:RNA polymerase sigma factor (sigma-70 family)
MTLNQYNNCVELYADGLYRFILKSIRDNDKAKDIIQDSFEKLWIKVDEINFEKVKSYLFSTAYHTMIDLIRKDKRSTSIDQIKSEVYVNFQSVPDIQDVLNTALTRLPEIQRTVLLLRDYEGYSYEEIGEITSLNESQVKVYIFRARSFLKNYIISLEKVI